MDTGQGAVDIGQQVGVARLLPSNIQATMLSINHPISPPSSFLVNLSIILPPADILSIHHSLSLAQNCRLLPSPYLPSLSGCKSSVRYNGLLFAGHIPPVITNHFWITQPLLWQCVMSPQDISQCNISLLHYLSNRKYHPYRFISNFTITSLQITKSLCYSTFKQIIPEFLSEYPAKAGYGIRYEAEYRISGHNYLVCRILNLIDGRIREMKTF